MVKANKAASFEDFLGASARLADRGSSRASDSKRGASARAGRTLSPQAVEHSRTSARKVKVGLTIDEGIVDAIDDYIYHERKQGRRLKKNDVYEAALRQFLGLEEGDIR